jgi:tRNA modification GTPase
LIEETVRFDGCTISLTDTAGLRETTDDVEREGIRRTKDAIEDADLLIVLVDASEVHQTAQAIDVSTFGSRNFIVVLNKIDLLSPELLPQLLCKLSLPENIRALPISTLTGEGLGTLRDTIKQRTGLLTMEPLQGVMITNVRHQEILLRCRDYLDKALDSINSGNHSECVAVDLRGAANALGEITGAITSDDILARIFSEFCIGK